MARPLLVLATLLVLASIFLDNGDCKRYYSSGYEYRLSPSQSGLNRYRWRYSLDGGFTNRMGRSRRSWALFGNEFGRVRDMLQNENM